jgi:hypothetical protein
VDSHNFLLKSSISYFHTDEIPLLFEDLCVPMCANKIT